MLTNSHPKIHKFDFYLMVLFFISTLFVAIRIPSLNLSFYPFLAFIVTIRTIVIKKNIGFKIEKIKSPVLLLALTLLMMTIISVLFSTYKVIAIKQLIKVFIYIIFAYYSSLVLSHEKNRNSIFKFIIWLLFALCLFGFYEYFYPQSEIFTIMRSQMSLVASPRIASLLQWPIQYGIILVFGVYLLFDCAKIGHILKYIMLSTYVIQIEMCQSRNAYLVLSVLCLMYIVFQKNWRKVLSIAVIFAMAFLIIPKPKNRFPKVRYDRSQAKKVSRHTQDAKTNLSKRFRLWKTGLKELNTKTILIGTGLDNFRLIINPIAKTREKNLHAHNLFLSIFFEIGIFALLVSLALVISLLKTYFFKDAIYPFTLFFSSQLLDFFLHDPFFNFIFILSIITLAYTPREKFKSAF